MGHIEKVRIKALKKGWQVAVQVSDEAGRTTWHYGNAATKDEALQQALGHVKAVFGE